MRDLFQGLGGASVLFAAASALIFTANIGRLQYFDLNSPYIAAFAGLGIAVGILFAMVMILVTNYRVKMEQGRKLVEYLTTVEKSDR